MARNFLTIFAPAVFLTGIMSLISWFLAGHPPMVGIDDAAITRAYAENIANGHGFVYNIGGEKVEGATSFLWTLIVSLAYWLPGNVQTIILTVSFVATVTAVAFSLRLGAKVASHFDISRNAMLTALCAVMAGMPGYFLWSVISMMEIAIWSAAITAFVWNIVGHLEDRRSNGALFALAAALPLIRPEGIAIAVGLLMLAIALAPRRSATPLIAIAAALVALGALVLFRLSYFGFPFPNTYYAKVSSDRAQDIEDGLKYLISFINEQPFADAYLLCWAGLTGLALFTLMKRVPENMIGFPAIAACVFGMLATYAMLGGDHFVQWRFYQPMLPLFAIAPAIVILLCIRSLWPYLRQTLEANIALAVTFILAIGCAWLPFYQARFDLRKEYILTQRGEVFGHFLNGFDPLPRLGVIAAGGIALSYEGWIQDLMGLNWARMAHANPIKVGYRNHASFDKGVFWDDPPDLIALFTRGTCQRANWVEPNASGGPLKGLIADNDFHENFSPIRLWADDVHCWNGFANNTWLSQIDDPRIEPVVWSDLKLGSY